MSVLEHNYSESYSISQNGIVQPFGELFFFCYKKGHTMTRLDGDDYKLKVVIKEELS